MIRVIIVTCTRNVQHQIIIRRHFLDMLVIAARSERQQHTCRRTEQYCLFHFSLICLTFETKSAITRIQESIFVDIIPLRSPITVQR